MTNRQSTAGSASTSLSTWAGKRLAERIAGRGAGREVFKLPICDSSLPYPNVLGLVASQARRSEGSGSAFSASGNACATRSCELRSRLPTASLCGYFERRAEPDA